MSASSLLKTALTSLRQFFQQLNKKPLGADLQLFFVTVVAMSILFALASFFTGLYPGNESGPDGLYSIGLLVLGIFISLIQGLIVGVVALLGVSLVEHFFLLFVNVHHGFEKTMKSVIYALFPCILFFWAVVIVEVPLAGLLLLFVFGLITYLSTDISRDVKGRAVFVSLQPVSFSRFFFYRWILVPGCYCDRSFDRSPSNQPFEAYHFFFSVHSAVL